MTIRVAGAVAVAMVLTACGGGSGSGAEGTSGGPGGGTGSGPGDTSGAGGAGPPGTGGGDPGTGTGGGGDEPVVMLLGPVEVALGQLPAGFSASYDPVANTVTLDDGTGPAVLSPGSGSLFEPFRVFSSNMPDFRRLVLAETASGSGVAGVYRTAQGTAGSLFLRLSDTQVPSSGTAAFSGRYFAVILDANASPVYHSVLASATLTADFAAGSVSGEITGRSYLSARGEPVILREASVSDGAFAGTTTGGEFGPSFINFNLRGTTTTPGSYSGLFTGADGQEVVGGVVIPHDNSGQPLTEYGAFVAERTGP